MTLTYKTLKTSFKTYNDFINLVLLNSILKDKGNILKKPDLLKAGFLV